MHEVFATLMALSLGLAAAALLPKVAELIVVATIALLPEQSSDTVHFGENAEDGRVAVSNT